MEHLFPYPKMGSSFLEILHDPLTRKLLGFDAVHAEETAFVGGISSRLTFLLNDTSKHLSFLKIGYTALEAFLQANCTGPPLDFKPEEFLFPESYRDAQLPSLKQELLRSLTVDGNAVYSLTPHIELFWLAKLIMSHAVLAEAGFNGRRARLRINCWHQRLLDEKSDLLQTILYKDAEVLEQQLFSRLAFGGAAAEEHLVEFLLERAQIRIFYADDTEARADLAKASKTRHFHFALTGALGKRTKFQGDDLSQLVLLAKSRDHEPEPYSSRKSSKAGVESRKASRDDSVLASPKSPGIPGKDSLLPVRSLTPTSPKYELPVSPLAAAPVQPENIQLNDDTLFEHIRFKQAPPYEPDMTHVAESDALPPRLAELDPSNQPLLFPLDSIILLATASSISNTSPVDGLTREETLPYVTRVLEGGSSNWQVYTQALLVRSRIEGYKARTAERGLLQLQALVDQVIAETSGATAANGNADPESTPSTFLPKPQASESASVAERLKYIYQLAPPLRWEIEAELAGRWTSMGGLKSALEIYERLQMHAEVALCLAATSQEKKAETLLRKLLFDGADASAGQEKLLQPQPLDAPRLLCILGDITTAPVYYQLAWSQSRQQYGRAQRSLGRYYTKQRQLSAAAQAYKLALERSQLDHATWFALGCVQLELLDWTRAVESFTRCVMSDEQDAEAWSNLAVALLRLPDSTPDDHDTIGEEVLLSADNEEAVVSADPSRTPTPPSATGRPRNKISALLALRRAAALKRDDARIWDNYLTVATSLPPNTGMTPWGEMIMAMGRVIELRGSKQGEACVDLPVFRIIVDYVTGEYQSPSSQAESSASDEAGPASKETEPFPELVDEPESASAGSGPESESPKAAQGAVGPENESPAPRQMVPYVVRAFLSLVDHRIAPLATSSPALHDLLADVALWRDRPAESLAYREKAWRAVSQRPGAYESEDGWNGVVDATLALLGAYRDLGGRERERTGGKVESGWKFKARSAVRSVMGKGRETWEGTEGWARLQGAEQEGR